MAEKREGIGNKKLTKRDFLKVSGAVAGGAILAGCSSQAASTAATTAAAIAAPAERWDYEADVIVCGTGPAGLCCAAAAAEGGISVIAIDANDKIGGKGILAGGNLGIGGGTRMQKDLGFVESAEIIYEDRTVPNLRTDVKMKVETVDGRVVEMGQWRKISGAEDGIGLSRTFADESLPTWNWLDGMGCAFIRANFSPMANVYRGSRYYTTTAAALVDRDNGKPGEMQAGGAGLCWPIYDRAVESGATFMLNCKMTKILRPDPNGRVTGIEATYQGRTIRMKANKAVFLGTGSWKGNNNLKQLFLPWLVKYPHVSGEPYVWNDGQGIQAAIDVGASLSTDRGSDWHGWHRHAGTRWHSIDLPFGLPGTAREPLDSECIYVNAEGRRFMNEEIGEDNPAWVGGSKPFYFAQICATQTTDEDGPIVWIILDETSRAKQNMDVTVGTITEPHMYGTANTIAELANAIRVPAAALTAAVNRYNELVDRGVDEDFEKRNLAAKIITPPFHAIKWGIQKHNTLGGVTIDPKAKVLDWRRNIIPGLYAAGESSGAMDLIGLARPILFGRVAGMTIAREE